MDSCVSETTSNASDDFTARDEFLGKNRSLRPSHRHEFDSEFGVEAEAKVCLDHVMWSKLPEELLIHIFARLPVKNILQIRSLSKSWRSTITSPQFQQAFSEASLVRISLLFESDRRETTFFSQENKEERFRYDFNRCCSEKLFESSPDIAGTASGLICGIKYEAAEPGLSYSIIRVFVMNLVTCICRELPSPHITSPLRPALVQMKASVNGGYTITFIYTKDREELQVTSWQVYDSVKNIWSKDDETAIADFKDVEVFNISCSWGLGGYYDVPTTFHKETKAISVFNLHEGYESFDPSIYPSNPRGHVHNVSGGLYELCTREGRHGVWRLLCSSKWEMVCECPDLEGVWTCLRVMNDLVVLIIELPVPYGEWCDEDEDCAHGGVVKVFHMPTKVWHSFSEDGHFTACFCSSDRYGLFEKCPFLVEIRFDSMP